MDIKRKIISGAIELFTRYGVRSVSMDDIARHLSISKKTIYQYFKDKDEVVALSMEAYIEYEKVEYGEVFDRATNAVEELAGVSRCIRKDLSEMNPALLFDLQKFHPRAWDYWLEFKYGYIRESVVNNLRRGIEQGYYRKEIDPDFLATLRVEQIQLVFNNKIFPSDKFNLVETQIKLFDHFVHGIVTQKGRSLYEKYSKENNLLTKIKT